MNTTLKLEKKPEEFEEVLELFRGLFGATLKSNPHLKQGLMTGILRIAKANFFSGLNNVRAYTLFDKHFATSYGFTQQEVDGLLSQVPTTASQEDIKYWYNGYKFGDQVLYNPWSIMCCLETAGMLAPYWLDSGGTQLVDAALVSDQIQGDLQKLIEGQCISSPITRHISFSDIRSPVGLYSLLLFSGYLNPDVVTPGTDDTDTCQLSIPNHEVRRIYIGRLLAWVNHKLKVDKKEYSSLVYLLASGKVTAFAASLQKLLHQSASFYQRGSQ